MKKLIIFLAVLAVLGIIFYFQHAERSVSKQVLEAAAIDTSEGGAVEQEPVEVGNTVCPVTGNAIDTDTKVTYEYEGKIYNFCCPACIAEFEKDPDKYVAIIEEQE